MHTCIQCMNCILIFKLVISSCLIVRYCLVVGAVFEFRFNCSSWLGVWCFVVMFISFVG